MFSGIIECVGNILDVKKIGENYHLWIKSNISKKLKIKDSVSHNGVCLTIIDIYRDSHKVELIKNSLDITTFKNAKINDIINIERSINVNDMIQGHIVQGHVDTIGKVEDITYLNGSYIYKIYIDQDNLCLIVKKGSICINGVSLTILDIQNYYFFVSIIPYTYNNTNFKNIHKGSFVNIEFDILGKYINRFLYLKEKGCKV